MQGFGLNRVNQVPFRVNLLWVNKIPFRVGFKPLFGPFKDSRVNKIPFRVGFKPLFGPFQAFSDRKTLN